MTLVNAAPPFPEPLSQEIYPLCDILCLNETEATIMTGLSINSINDGKITCQLLLDKGCGSVILTMGENGAIFMDKNSNFHIPILDKLIPIDTTVSVLIYNTFFNLNSL
jgi:ribokinase